MPFSIHSPTQYLSLIAIVLSALLAHCQTEEPPQSPTLKAFTEHWQKAESAIQNADFDSAASHYQAVIKFFPFEPTSRFRLACCLSEQGELDAAVSQLEKAVQYGWADAQALRTSKHLVPLQKESRLAKLIGAAEDCQRETCLIHCGDQVNPNRPTAVLVLLHGLGCGPRAEMPYWSAVADELGWIAVAPRSQTKVGPMLYGWHRAGAKDSSSPDYFDIEAAKSTIEDALENVRQQHEIDDRQVYLAGFSQGGGVALQLQREPDSIFRGTVAVCSLCHPAGPEAWQAAFEKHPFRVALIAGSLDRLLPRSQQVAEELRTASIPLQYDELLDIGHEYPADYSSRLRAALEFIADPKSSSAK